ncbi:MAG: T9SS type A sorting domain-containing protein, partial [Ignavibacteriales bacterium]|nr:T9SS type A sorting domain-containing protein [Ignavibacteriales bacterium]
AALVDENKQPGNYTIKFNAEHLPSGIYFYRFQAGDFSETKKMILTK